MICISCDTVSISKYVYDNVNKLANHQTLCFVSSLMYYLIIINGHISDILLGRMISKNRSNK